MLPGRSFSAWSKSRQRLDKLLPDLGPWTLHDLRRTWSTNAERLDIPPHLIALNTPDTVRARRIGKDVWSYPLKLNCRKITLDTGYINAQAQRDGIWYDTRLSKTSMSTVQGYEAIRFYAPGRFGKTISINWD